MIFLNNLNGKANYVQSKRPHLWEQLNLFFTPILNNQSP